MEKVQVFCENTSTLHQCEPGISLEELSKTLDHKCTYTPLGAIVDNQLKELSYKIYNPHIIRFIDLSHPDGRRIYMRTLSFILQRSAVELFPEYRLTFNYTLPNGLYGEIREKEKGEDGKYPVITLTKGQVEALKGKMDEYIGKNLPIEKKKLPRDIASSIFRTNGYTAKSALAENSKHYFISTYSLDGYSDTFYGPLLVSTGCVDLFDLSPYRGGFCLQAPSSSDPTRITDYKYQDKLNNVFKEHSQWNDILGVETLAHLNQTIEAGKIVPIIQIAEALHERKSA